MHVLFNHIIYIIFRGELPRNFSTKVVDSFPHLVASFSGDTSSLDVTECFQICIRRRPQAIKRPCKVSSALLLCTTPCTRASLARVSRLIVSSGCDHPNVCARIYTLCSVSVVVVRTRSSRSLARSYRRVRIRTISG